jgi:Lon protease-like protein
MPGQLIPLFPLSVVLLPGMPLPLHIFEERYKEMMGDVIPDGEFGVVLAKDGGIVNVGCTAVVSAVVQRYSDGRLDLVASGQRRFLIHSLDEEKSYLRAEVQFFDDEDVKEASADLKKRAGVAFRKLMKIERPNATVEPTLENVGRMSFQIAQFIGDLDKRQTVLSLRSEIERLEFLVRIVPGYLVQREQTELAKRVGPLNGHAKHIKGAE